MMRSLLFVLATLQALAWSSPKCRGADSFDGLASRYTQHVRPMLVSSCINCHSSAKREGELDLEKFVSLKTVRNDSTTWTKVLEMIQSHEMPPRDQPQLSDSDHKELVQWINDYIAAEAEASAGDPGPVVLRRLNNAEYTYTIQDLTGQALEPTREFPVDSAAGEGFTNTGNALVMSPSLLSKYLQAAKEVAEHAVLLADGIKFSPYTTPRDRTDDVLKRLREFYGRYTENTGSTRVNLQGLQWDTNAGGRLPVARYLQAIIERRNELKSGQVTIEKVATDSQLNKKYLSLLWQQLNNEQASSLIRSISEKVGHARKEDVEQIANDIATWQQALTKFQSVGHMKPWLADIQPTAPHRDIRLDLSSAINAVSKNDAIKHVRIALLSSDAGDSSEEDRVVWNAPRLVAAGRMDIGANQIEQVHQQFLEQRAKLFSEAKGCFNAAAELLNDSSSESSDSAQAKQLLSSLAEKHSVSVDSLKVWFDYLGLTSGHVTDIKNLLTNRLENIGGHKFVNGWGAKETPNMAASSGDTLTRIPGSMKPHGVVLHPSPTLQIVASWRSTINGRVRISGSVTHAHPECGNGVTWELKHRKSSSTVRLANGTSRRATPVPIPDLEPVRVRPGRFFRSLLVRWIGIMLAI